MFLRGTSAGQLARHIAAAMIRKTCKSQTRHVDVLRAVLLDEGLQRSLNSASYCRDCTKRANEAAGTPLIPRRNSLGLVRPACFTKSVNASKDCADPLEELADELGFALAES